MERGHGLVPRIGIRNDAAFGRCVPPYGTESPAAGLEPRRPTA